MVLGSNNDTELTGEEQKALNTLVALVQAATVLWEVRTGAQRLTDEIRDLAYFDENDPANSIVTDELLQASPETAHLTAVQYQMALALLFQVNAMMTDQEASPETGLSNRQVFFRFIQGGSLR